MIIILCDTRCVAKMAETYSTTSFDQLSVGQPPPIAPPRKPETEMNSVMVTDDWRWATSNKGEGQWRLLIGNDMARTGAARRRKRQGTETSTSSTGFVGLMQQLAVNGRELFELAERGHFDVVDSTATDMSGEPVTFTSPEAYLSLTCDSQSSTFSVYFRVSFSASSLYAECICDGTKSLFGNNSAKSETILTKFYRET